MAKTPVKKPSARAEEIRKTRATETAKANMASRAEAAAKSKTVWGITKRVGAKALSRLDVAGRGATVIDAITDFRAAKTGADYGMATARLAQGAHPIGWIGGPVIEELQNYPEYQNIQTRALDWVDSVNPTKKLRDLAANSAATKRKTTAKTTPKGKK